MNYGTYLGNEFSNENTGISQERTNPSQIGYSVSKPLARVRKHSLDNTVAVSALNHPCDCESNKLENTVAVLGNISDTTSQFASDLLEEAKTFATGSVVSGIPNYWFIVGIVVTGFVIGELGSNSKYRRRR